MTAIASHIRSAEHARFWSAGAILLSIAIGFVRPVAAVDAHSQPDARAPLPLPDGIKIPAYQPGPIPFHQGEQLVYRVSWIGIPAAEASIILRGEAGDPRTWSGEASISTSRLVDVFYRMRANMREEFDGNSLAPRDIHMTQRENQRTNEYRISFDRQAGLVTSVRRNKKGSDTARFVAGDPMGPISGTIMALSQPLTIGQKLIFDVFGGRNRYVIEFAVVRRERIQTAIGAIDAIRVVPRLVYVSDEDSRRKARETTIWISADDRRLPLRIEAAAFIGKLRIDLIRVVDTSPEATPRWQNAAQAQE